MTNLKVIELFAGIGAVHEALKRWDLSFEVVDAVELDKTAMKAYNAIHNTKFETQDILTWDKNIKCDYLHTSPPCQAFSVNGKGLGAEDSRGWDLWAATLRIIKQTDPKWVTLENVKGLLNKKHKKVLDKYIQSMNELGYQTVVKTYNAKDFGVPQNRERVFIISIRLDMYNYVFKLRENYFEKRTIANILETNAKWYTNRFLIENLFNTNYIYLENQLNLYKGLVIEVDLNKARLENGSANINIVGILKNIKFKDFCKNGSPVLSRDKITEIIDYPYLSGGARVYKTDGTIGTLDTAPLNKTIMDIPFNEDKAFKDIYGQSGTITATNPMTKNKIMTTLTTENKKEIIIKYRKLTTLDCCRLMDFSDNVHKELKASNFSDNQMGKLFGNSMVVNVIYEIIGSFDMSINYPMVNHYNRKK